MTPRRHISTGMWHTMHGSRKEYLGNRVPQRSEFGDRRDGECSPSRRRYAAPTPSRERGSPAGCEGTQVRARQARAVPMTSESGGRIGARRRAQRLGGQARGCEAFCGSKGYGTSRESTSSVKSTSSIGRAIVSGTVGRRFKSGVFIPSERLSLPRLESVVILGPLREPRHPRTRKVIGCP